MPRLFGKQLRAYLAWKLEGKKPPHQARSSSPRSKPRKGPARDEAYKAFVRLHPCAACHRTAPSEAAHTGSDGGLSMKASDYSCIPLCAECHTRGDLAYHRIGKRAFERLHGLRGAAVAAELRRAWRAERAA